MAAQSSLTIPDDWLPLCKGSRDDKSERVSQRKAFEDRVAENRSKESFWFSCYLVAIDQAFDDDFVTLATRYNAPASCLRFKKHSKDTFVRKFSCVRNVRQHWGCDWWIKLCHDGISFPLEPSKNLMEHLLTLAKVQEYDDAVLLLRTRLIQEEKPRGSRGIDVGVDRNVQLCDIRNILRDLRNSELTDAEDNVGGEELTEQSDDDPYSPKQRAYKRRRVQNTQRDHPLPRFLGSQRLSPLSALPVDPSHTLASVPFATESLLPSRCTRASMRNNDSTRLNGQSSDQEAISPGSEPQFRDTSEGNKTGRRNLRSTSTENLQSILQLQASQIDSNRIQPSSAITGPFEHLYASLQSLRQQLKSANHAERQAEQMVIEAEQEMVGYSRQVSEMAVITPRSQSASQYSQDHDTNAAHEDLVNRVADHIEEIDEIIRQAQAFAKARQDFDNSHIGPSFFECTEDPDEAFRTAIRYHEQRKVALEKHKTRLDELNAAVITAGTFREEKKAEADDLRTILIDLKNSVDALDPYE